MKYCRFMLDIGMIIIQTEHFRDKVLSIQAIKLNYLLFIEEKNIF